MENREKGREGWLNTATHGIRFKPDRAAVRAELEAHLEDKKVDLCRNFPHMPPEEAESWALASMGDPQEIGKELAEIYKPWLGYLWRISQWVAGVAICFALFSSLVTSMDFWPAQYQDSWLGSMGMEGFLEKLYPECQDITCRSLTPGEGQRIGEYMVRVTQVELWEVQTEQGPEKAVQLILEVENQRPWESVSGEVNSRLWAEDDRGNRLKSSEEMMANPADILITECVLSGVAIGHTPFKKELEFILFLPDPAAKWLTLRYNWLGAELSLPVFLGEEQI